MLLLAIILATTRGVSLQPTGDVTNFRSYEEFKVVRSYPKNENHHRMLRETLVEMCELLKVPNSQDSPVDALCSPAEVPSYLSRIARDGMAVESVVENLGDLIHRQQKEQTERRQKRDATFDFSKYHRYDTIVDWVKQLAEENPTFFNLTEIGRSVEDRPLYLIKLGTSPSGNQTRAVWIDGGIHAREWIAVSTVAFLVDQLVKSFKTEQPSDCKISSVQAVDWYIVPVVNPDGYEFSHTTDRMWRKNRRPAPANSSCVGVDLNRNCDVTGYGVGASADPCSQTFMGTPDSEPEIQALEKNILKLKYNIGVYLTFHSYGQDILTSFGYTVKKPQDLHTLSSLANGMAAAILSENIGRTYKVQTAAGLYPAGGASDDWAKIKAEIQYSFTIELPDQGEYGFVLPAEEIIPVGAEMWEAVKLVSKVAGESPLGPDPASGLPPV